MLWIKLYSIRHHWIKRNLLGKLKKLKYSLLGGERGGGRDGNIKIYKINPQCWFYPRQLFEIIIRGKSRIKFTTTLIIRENVLCSYMTHQIFLFREKKLELKCILFVALHIQSYQIDIPYNFPKLEIISKHL